MWGVERPWRAALPLLKELGFIGIEAPLPSLQQHPEVLAATPGLRYLPMIFTEGDTVADHVRSFREQLTASLAYEPDLVTCHDGRDAFSLDEAAAYYEAVLAIEADLGVRVAHETHRGRILYNPWTTARLLDRFDGLLLCCDFSHWVCVCERLIDDQEDIIRQCARQALHLHARVGYEEGPQVPDPRAPEYADHVAAHERWWDILWDAQQARGFEATTLTPEFGPPFYMRTLPHTNVPVADLWDICTWQAQRQARRFEERYPAE
jgi:sugar phosphate isomerase/epimerase